MTSRNEKDEGSSFGKLLTWTVALALVFSAGLITGQRLLRRAAMQPMVSLSSTTTGQVKPPETRGDGDEPTPTSTSTEPLKTTFSFYQHLTAAPSPSPSKKKKTAKKTAKKPTDEKQTEKPAEAEEKAEERPAETEEAAVADEQPAESDEKPNPEPASDESEPADAPPTSADAPDSDTADEKPGVLDTIARVLDDEDDTARDEAPEEKAAALPARYTLQVSSHPDRDSAEREMGRLRKLGVEPHVVVVEVPGKGKLWRIRVGKFHSMDEARNFQRSLKSKRGVPGFVTPL